MTPEEIEELAGALAPLVAREVAALLGPGDAPVFPTRGLVDVDQVAQLLKVEREWIYAHKGELGAVRIGEGRRGPLRFEAARVLAYIAAHRVDPPAPEPPRRGRPRKRSHAEFEVLPIPDKVRG